MVNNVMHTLKTHFVNPFDSSLDSDKLYNVVSNTPVISSISLTVYLIPRKVESCVN